MISGASLRKHAMYFDATPFSGVLLYRFWYICLVGVYCQREVKYEIPLWRLTADDGSGKLR